MTSSWFFLSTLNYDARSNTHQLFLSTLNYDARPTTHQFHICLLHCTAVIIRIHWRLKEGLNSKHFRNHVFHNHKPTFTHYLCFHPPAFALSLLSFPLSYSFHQLRILVYAVALITPRPTKPTFIAVCISNRARWHPWAATQAHVVRKPHNETHNVICLGVTGSIPLQGAGSH